METIRERLGVVQNLSLMERGVRAVMAVILIGLPCIDLLFFEGIFGGWHATALLLSVYPGLTGMLGWDPFYELGGHRTCGLSDRNQCGTLPFQIDALFGRHPIPDHDYDHSLAGSHH
jgi:hypothetical protein